MKERDKKHLIVITHGQEDGGARATLGFALAVTLQAMGCDVAVYLNFQAAVWAFPNVTESCHIKGFERLQTYISLFQESGGKIYICSSCFENLPRWSSDDVEQSAFGPMNKNVIPAGVTTLAALLIERKTLTF